MPQATPRRAAFLAVHLIAGLLATAATAAAAETVRVCGLRFTSSASLFIAVDKGYFRDEGVEVDLKFFDAAQPVAVAVAVASGDCDVGVTGLTAGLYNLAGKGVLKVVAGEAWEEPGFDFIGYVASNKAVEAGLRRPEDLPGKRFGVSQLGSAFHYNVGMLAAKHGWPDSAVRLVPLQSVANMVAAVKSGQVDAVAVPSFIAYGLEKSGEAKVIGWVHQQTLWQVSAVIASTRMIETNRPLLERVVRAYVRGTTAYHQAFNARDAAGQRVFGAEAESLVPIVEKYTKASRQHFLDGAAYVDPAARFKAENIVEQIAWYRARGFFVEGVSAERVPWRTVAANVALPLEGHRLSAAERTTRVARALALCGLSDFAGALPKQFSGGMRQRVGIARAVAVKPAVLMLDEPLSALDAQTRDLLIEDLMAIVAAERVTAVWVTHNLDEALRVGDRIVVLSRRPGRVKAIVPVALPRDARADLGNAAEIARLHARLWDLIRDEAAMADREVAHV